MFKLEETDKDGSAEAVVQPQVTPQVKEEKPPTQVLVPDATVKTAAEKKADAKGDKSKAKVVQPEVKAATVVETPEFVPPVPQDDLMIRRLGEIALASLNAGEAIKDEIVAHLIIEQIKRLPKDKGWVIDGFPLTYNQAKLLEKGLTGYDDDKPFPVRPKKESILAPNPKPDPPPLKHVSSIDLVLNLEVSNETVLKRSAGRFCKSFSLYVYFFIIKFID